MKMDKSVQITLIIVIGLIIIGVIVISGIGNISNPSQNTISVMGQSTINVMPDLVSIYFSSDTKGATSIEASDKNSQIVDNLTNALISQGFTNDQIQTQSFSVSPTYDWTNGTGVITGYEAIQIIEIQIPANESQKIGPIIDSGVNVGAGISNINFELSQADQNTYKTEAMKLAAQDATSKASGIADGLGKQLGDLVSVSTGNYDYAPWPLMNVAGASTAEVQKAVTNIQPSQQEISASVTAVFKIK